MGNQISNPSNNDQFTDSLLGKEIKKIIMEKTVPNINDVKFFQDENKNKNIKINQLKACCVGAVGEAGQINSTLGIGFPTIDPSIQNIKTDCKPGQNCLMTKNIGFTIETKDRSQYCGSNMDAKSSDAKTCDALLTDTCAKQLYEQGCIKLSGKKGPTGKSLASWNTLNPMCVSKMGGKPVLYTGSSECACVNSIFGPVLNKGPSYKLHVNKTLTNPYGLTDKTLDFDDNNEDTLYSLNIFKQDNMAIHPGVLDNRCIAKKNFKTETAYNMSWDRDVKIGAVCIQQINLSDSNVGKAVFEDNKFENNCGNPTRGDNIKPTITDDEDLRLAEEQRQKEIAQKKAEEEKRKADETAKLKELEELRIKQLKEQEENEKLEKARLEKLAAEQQAKYAEEIKKQEDDKKAKELADKIIKEENEQKEALDRVVKEEALIAELKRKILKEQELAKATTKTESAIQLDQSSQPNQPSQQIKPEEKSSVNLYIGGAIGIILILVVLFLFFKSGSNPQKEEINDESD